MRLLKHLFLILLTLFCFLSAGCDGGGVGNSPASDSTDTTESTTSEESDSTSTTDSSSTTSSTTTSDRSVPTTDSSSTTSSPDSSTDSSSTTPSTDSTTTEGTYVGQLEENGTITATFSNGETIIWKYKRKDTDNSIESSVEYDHYFLKYMFSEGLKSYYQDIDDGKYDKPYDYSLVLFRLMNQFSPGDDQFIISVQCHDDESGSTAYAGVNYEITGNDYYTQTNYPGSSGGLMTLKLQAPAGSILPLNPSGDFVGVSLTSFEIKGVAF